MTGVNVALTANIPDLSALSPLARRPLPALKTIAFQTTLTDAGGGFRHGAALHALTFTERRRRPVRRRRDRSRTPTVSDSGPQIESHRPRHLAGRHRPDAAAPRRIHPPAPGAKPPRHRRPRNGAMNTCSPTRPIPFDLLRLADADLKLDVADLRAGGADYKAINTHAVLANGKLTVDPFAAELPGGHLTGTLSVDATPDRPPGPPRPARAWPGAADPPRRNPPASPTPAATWKCTPT